MRVLFFGDIVGKIGRKAVGHILPELKKQFAPDLVLANAENAAHGIGFTPKILKELIDAGVDFFTSGNHVFSKPDGVIALNDPAWHVIRPANYDENLPGVGYRVINVGSRQVLVINLMGQVFMKEELQSPFHVFDEILSRINREHIAAIIIDFHGEATSEKVAFGWYADGRASVIVGTHTHVPTADHKILPHGTAYVTDLGMVGAVDSVIGDVKEPIIQSFLHQTALKLEIPEAGDVAVNAIVVDIDPLTKQATHIERVDRIVRV